MLGHSRGTMTSRYVHVVDDTLLAAADRVSVAIARAMSGKAAATVTRIGDRRRSCNVAIGTPPPTFADALNPEARMAKSRRGGKRQGAGRKPTLSELDRLAVGAEANSRIWRATEAWVRARVEAKHERYNLKEKSTRVRSIPLPERKRWSQHSEDDGSTAGDAVYDVRDAIGAWMRDGSKKVIVSPGRAGYGLRREIITAVSADWSRKRGRSISPRLVERCLEEYRAIERRLPKPEV